MKLKLALMSFGFLFLTALPANAEDYYDLFAYDASIEKEFITTGENVSVKLAAVRISGAFDIKVYSLNGVVQSPETLLGTVNVTAYHSTFTTISLSSALPTVLVARRSDHPEVYQLIHVIESTNNILQVSAPTPFNSPPPTQTQAPETTSTPTTSNTTQTGTTVETNPTHPTTNAPNPSPTNTVENKETKTNDNPTNQNQPQTKEENTVINKQEEQVKGISVSTKFHPVIFIHGFGGTPEAFTGSDPEKNYKELFLNAGYPEDFIRSYHYCCDQNGVYNNQGDITEIAGWLEKDVRELSEKHKALGGDGTVDIVAHSMGGLVARYYLSTHLNNHNVRKLILVGTPNKGSWILNLDKNVREFPTIGETVEQSLRNGLSRLLMDLNLDIRNLNPSSQAGKQMTPGSEFLTQLSKDASTNTDYYTLFGDISVTLKQSIFHYQLTKTVSIGDGIVSAESATNIPKTAKQSLAYNDTIDANINLIRSSDAFSLEVAFPKPSTIRFFHLSILNQSEIKDKLKEYLN